MKSYLHIGLHKTATTYLQRRVFANARQLIYNPKPLMSALNVCTYRQDFGELRMNDIGKARDLLEQVHASAHGKSLLISLEKLSQDIFLMNWEERADLITNLFPDACLIIFLRFQPDRLLSLYKQSLKRGHYQALEEFLNYRDGEFRGPREFRQSPRLPSVDALGMDYCEWLDELVVRFGRENVHVFFYEDFRRDQRSIAVQMCRLLGIPKAKVPPERWENRGYAALSCEVLSRVGRGLERLGIVRRTTWADRGRGYLQKHTRALALSEEGLDWLAGHKSLKRRVASRLGFESEELRHVLPQLIDKIVYYDWDLLAHGGMRMKLDAHYGRLNRCLERHVPRENVPERYFASELHGTHRVDDSDSLLSRSTCE